MYITSFKDYILDTNSKSTLKFKMHLGDAIQELPNKTKSYIQIHKIINTHYFQTQQKDFRFTLHEKILKDAWNDYFQMKLKLQFLM